MFKRKVLTRWFALLACLAALLVPASVFAGGWAVVSLDQLPGQVTAGQPLRLGLMVRQHGRTPWQADALKIEARQADTGQVLSFSALSEGQPGHYQVELLFPQAGRWEWGVASGLYPERQPMPALEVAPAAALAANDANNTGGESSSGQPVTTPWVVGLAAAALLALAGGIALIARSRSSRLRLLGGAGMLVVCGGLVFGLVTRANAQPRQAQPTAQIMPTGATGQQLFLAKGCVVCHVNERALANSAQFGVGSGPDLSAYRNDAAFLQTWLKDPQAVKANTEMPNLGLKAEEIEALVKFINGEE